MALIKPLVNYSGEFSVIQSGDVIDTTAGGTGLSSFTTGAYLRALDSSTLQMLSPLAVRTDLAAIAFTSSEIAPSSPLPGDEWLKPSAGKKYKWIHDGDSGQWVEWEATQVLPNSIQTYIQDTQPVLDSQFLWVQTGLGDDGTGFTIWFNDNT